MRLLLDAAWRERLRQRSDQPPLAPRLPLWWGGRRIGSVQEDFVARLGDPAIASRWLRSARIDGEAGWEVRGELTAALGHIAFAMREAGLAHAWRDEQLAVTDASGEVLGSVEPAAVRPLGITTFAVHLAGFTPTGECWVQQRSLSKPNDPGLWDTLMGGMVPASDALEDALARETWEEAGLRMAQLQALAYGGRVAVRRPTGDVRGGYVVEWIDWYHCIVPQACVPENQDGEVAQFRRLAAGELSETLSRDGFTLEAALVLSEFSDRSLRAG